MNIIVDTTLPPTRNLIAGVTNTRIVDPKSLFYGDKLPLEIYPTDGVGSLVNWAGISSITIAIGNLVTGEQYVTAQSTSFDGESYNAILDLDTNAIATATSLEESVPVTFEIQANHANGDVETILQTTYQLKNQFLFAQNVTNTAPVNPSDVDAQIYILPIPANPSDLLAETTPSSPDTLRVIELRAPSAPSDINATWARPLAPSDIIINVQPIAPNQLSVAIIPVPYVPSDVQTALITPARPSSVRGQLVAQSVPLPPSDLNVSFDTEPLAPSQITTYCYKAPRAPQWVFVNVATQSVTDVRAELLTPSGVSDLDVVDLLTIEPVAPQLDEVQTIPLEPSEVARDSSPRKPSEITLDISPLEPTITSVVDYANRVAGMYPFGGPSNLDTRIVYGAGDPNGDVPTEVNAVLYNNRSAGFPSAQFGITNVESELLTPPAPSNITPTLDGGLDQPSMVNIGDMHGEQIGGGGNVIKQGTYFTITLDSSGSMNRIFPPVQAGAIKLRDYARVLYYGGNTQSARKYIRDPLARSNEDWLQFLQNFNSHDAIELVFINESSSIYHSRGVGSDTNYFNNQLANYKNYYTSKTNLLGKVQRGYIVGYGIPSSWSSISDVFRDQLDRAIYGNGNLQSHGVSGFFDYESNAGTDATVEFLIKYLRIPQKPDELLPEIYAYQNAQHADKWLFRFADLIQGKTGTFDSTQPNNIVYTMAGWDLEISLTSGGAIIETINMGDTLPNTMEINLQTNALLVGKDTIYGRLVARGLGSYASKYSIWRKCERLPRAINQLQTTIV